MRRISFKLTKINVRRITPRRNLIKKYNHTNKKTSRIIMRTPIIKNRFNSKFNCYRNKIAQKKFTIFHRTNINQSRTKYTFNNVNMTKTMCSHNKSIRFFTRTQHHNNEVLKKHIVLRNKLNINEIQPTNVKLIENRLVPEVFRGLINAHRIKILMHDLTISDKYLNELTNDAKLSIVEKEEFNESLIDTVKYFSNERKKHDFNIGWIIIGSIYYIGCCIVLVPAIAGCLCIFMTGAILITGFWSIVFGL